MLHRRKFLTGLVSALAAPAIVRPGLLMPVRKVLLPMTMQDYFDKILNEATNRLAEQVANNTLYGEMYNGCKMYVGNNIKFEYVPLNKVLKIGGLQ